MHNGIDYGNTGYHGVRANSSVTDGYGFVTNDRTYSSGGYYPSKSGSFAINTGSETLVPGDIVAIAGGYRQDVLEETEDLRGKPK